METWDWEYVTFAKKKDKEMIEQLMTRSLIVWTFNKFQRYVKFAIVGGFGSLLNWTILYCLTEYAGLWYLFSATVGVMVAATNNYFINHYWAFRKERDKNKNMILGWAKYQAVNGICGLLYLGLLALFTEKFGTWYMLSAVMAVLISSTIMFFAVRQWIWGKK